MEVRMSGLLNTAILWDIENVTPPAGSGYIQSIIETIEEGGKISYAMAFGNWNRPGIKNIAGDLAANSFELIHVPKSRKDSSDMSMVAHGVELIFQYPHVERYVLITGDADFRPLLLSLRKYGKQTLIICDAKNASEDLLKMADDYRDYREIIDDDEEAESRSDDGETETPENSLAARRRLAFELLEEAVRSMLKEKYSQFLTDGKELAKEPDTPEQEKKFLVKLNSFISSKISLSNLNSEMLADHMCLSKSQLNRKVKSISGMNTTTYINQSRLAHAQVLLRDKERSIGDIVLMCGFESASYFAKQFKKKFGMTPSQYRKKNS